MTSQSDDPKEYPVIRQFASKPDCAVILVEKSMASEEHARFISVLALCDESAVLRLSECDSPPWRDERFRKFQATNERRQLVIAGSVMEPPIVGLCLYSLEEGYQTFCVDLDLSNRSPKRQLNLDRLAHSGVTLLSIDQFAAEISFSSITDEP